MHLTWNHSGWQCHPGLPTPSTCAKAPVTAGHELLVPLQHLAAADFSLTFSLYRGGTEMSGVFPKRAQQRFVKSWIQTQQLGCGSVATDVV
jgi:hypothetical protein